MVSHGTLGKCEVCGRKVLLENILCGVSHTVQIIVHCWDCCSDEVKEKARAMYKIKEE